MKYIKKVENVQEYNNRIVCKGILELVEYMKIIDGVPVISHKPIIYSELEKITDEDYWYDIETKGIHSNWVIESKLIKGAKKILVLPDMFSVQTLKEIELGGLKSGMEVFIECESNTNNDGYQIVLFYLVGENSAYVNVFPVIQMLLQNEIFPPKIVSSTEEEYEFFQLLFGNNIKLKAQHNEFSIHYPKQVVQERKGYIPATHQILSLLDGCLIKWRKNFYDTASDRYFFEFFDKKTLFTKGFMEILNRPIIFNKISIHLHLLVSSFEEMDKLTYPTKKKLSIKGLGKVFPVFNQKNWGEIKLDINIYYLI